MFLMVVNISYLFNSSQSLKSNLMDAGVHCPVFQIVCTFPVANIFPDKICPEPDFAPNFLDC